MCGNWNVRQATSQHASTTHLYRGMVLDTAFGACCCSACNEYQSTIRTSCRRVLLHHGLIFSTAWWMMQLISGEKHWKHVSVQKVVTLNTCCKVACLTFPLPHITTGSFQSHQYQPTTSSFQSHQYLEERNIQGSPVTFFRCGGPGG